MKCLDRYILRQYLIPLAMATVIITATVWLTQILRRIDIVPEYSNGMSMLLSFCILIIPGLLAAVIPYTISGAVVYALYRMHMNSETAIIAAAGAGPLRLGAPALWTAFAGALFLLYANADLVPSSKRMIGDKIADLLSGPVTSFLKENRFTDLGNGLTVFFSDTDRQGRMRGLFVNDRRDSRRPVVYIAEKATIGERNANLYIFLENGNLQWTQTGTDADNAEDSTGIVRFESWTVDLGRRDRASRRKAPKLSGRYIGELLNPDPARSFDRLNAGRMVAEGHARLAAPVYILAYTVTALLLMGTPVPSRRETVTRIILWAVIIVSLGVAGFIIQIFAGKSGAMWAIHAFPAIYTLGAAALLFRPRPCTGPAVHRRI